MLPTKNRVKKEFFAEIMKNGQFFHGENLYLRLLMKKEQKSPTFSFIIPNKVKKTSVGRHLIKRRISAVVEKALSNIKTDSSGLVFVKKDVSRLPYSEITKEVVVLLKKAKILKE